MNDTIKHKVVKYTVLYEAHVSSGAFIGMFAGYKMPIYYKDLGLYKEHMWARSHASILDISHMGQIICSGNNVVDFLEKITPSIFSKMLIGKMKYTVFLNSEGTIIDDVVVSRIGENSFYIVVNASRKKEDLSWLKENARNYNVSIDMLENRALIACCGPKSLSVISNIFGDVVNVKPFSFISFDDNVVVSRISYAGGDGFEISILEDKAVALWKNLYSKEYVKPAGLGARNSLRLEAGYPLYGLDIDHTTSLHEAGMSWLVKGNNFIGANRVKSDKINGVLKKRYGIILNDRRVAYANDIVCDVNQKKIGIVTSGSFSPLLNLGICQAYVDSNFCALEGAKVFIKRKNNLLPACISRLPFVNLL